MNRLVVLAAIVTAWATVATAQSLPPPVQSQVNAGKQIFETTCASSTCHGSGGAGGQAPKLRDRDLSLDLIREALLNGRSGTPMPPFKDVLYPDMQVDVMAFVLSIASNGRLPTSVITAAAAAAAAPAPPKSEPVAVGGDKGTPSIGAAIFFDATRLSSCRVCHSYNKAGGPVGTDLADVRKIAVEMLASITQPRQVALGYVALSLAMKDGTRLTGIKRDENADVLRLADISSVPPVVRTLVKADIATTTTLANVGIYDHSVLGYGKQELVDLAAFLGKP